MNFMNDNDPGLTTGIFTRVDRRTRNSVTVYRLRQTRSGHLIDIEDDGAGPTGPNQKRQRLLKSISDQIDIAGEMVPKLHADNSGMGSVDGPGGYPVSIAIADDRIRQLMAEADRQREPMRLQAEQDAEAKAPKKRRRKKKVEAQIGE